MPSIDLFAAIGIIFIFLTLGILFLIPADKDGRRRAFKKKKETDTHKDWQEVSLRLEKHIYALRREIAGFQVREKNLQKEIVIQKEKYAKLQEKLSQERHWQKKEHSDTEKRGEELIHLRQELKTTEENLAKEHGQRLLLERQIKELQELNTQMNNAKRSDESQIARLQAQVETYQKELTQLRRENAALAKKYDESTWVAKPEYEKLEERLRRTEREYQLFKENIHREKL